MSPKRQATAAEPSLEALGISQDPHALVSITNACRILAILEPQQRLDKEVCASTSSVRAQAHAWSLKTTLSLSSSAPMHALPTI